MKNKNDCYSVAVFLEQVWTNLKSQDKKFIEKCSLSCFLPTYKNGKPKRNRNLETVIERQKQVTELLEIERTNKAI